MAKSKDTFLEVRVRLDDAEQKEWFQAAAAAGRRSLSQWFIVAAQEKVIRDGVVKPTAPVTAGKAKR